MNFSPSQGILFLSHKGLSFLDELVAIAKKMGLESYVLSSKPSLENEHRYSDIEAITDWPNHRNPLQLHAEYRLQN